MACMTLPTRLQLSNEVPFTNPRSLNSRVGRTRILAIRNASHCEKIFDQLESKALTFFRMELRAENAPFAYDRWKLTAISGGGNHISRVLANQHIAVQEVEVLSGWDIPQQRAWL